MKILESIRIALGMLSLHKLRAFLTMLGVIIGVMSVSLIILLVNGFQTYIEGEFSGLAADTIYVIYDPQGDGGQGGFEGVDEGIASYLTTRATKIRSVSGIVETGNHIARWKAREAEDVKVSAIDENNNLIFTKELVEGRLLNDEDMQELASVAVITEDLKKDLFGDKSAVGERVQLPGITVEIVGVMKEPPQIGGPPSGKVMEIPVTTAQRKWVGGRTYTFMLARAAEGVPVQEAMDEVWELLMQRTDNKPIFRVDSNESLLGVFSAVIGSVGVVLAGIAALSLLVGGIGIMNIMLVSVTERTREIGLRKAVGAKQGAILSQFLVESAMLSLVGGLIGMGLAWVLGLIVTVITKSAGFPNDQGLQAPFPVEGALFAALFSAAIGMVFGFFPALSASKLDPIVALRYE